MIYLLVFGFVALLFFCGLVFVFVAFFKASAEARYVWLGVAALFFVGAILVLRSVLTPASVSSDKTIAKDEDVVIHEEARVQLEELPGPPAAPFQASSPIQRHTQWDNRQSFRESKVYYLQGIGAAEGYHVLTYPNGHAHFWKGQGANDFTTAVEYPGMERQSGERLQQRFGELSRLPYDANLKLVDPLFLGEGKFLLIHLGSKAEERSLELIDLEGLKSKVIEGLSPEELTSDIHLVPISPSQYLLAFNSGWLSYARPMDLSVGHSLGRFSHLVLISRDALSGTRLLRLSLKKGLITGYQGEAPTLLMQTTDARVKEKPVHRYWRLTLR